MLVEMSFLCKYLPCFFSSYLPKLCGSKDEEETCKGAEETPKAPSLKQEEVHVKKEKEEDEEAPPNEDNDGEERPKKKKKKQVR